MRDERPLGDASLQAIPHTQLAHPVRQGLGKLPGHALLHRQQGAAGGQRGSESEWGIFSRSVTHKALQLMCMFSLTPPAHCLLFLERRGGIQCYYGYSRAA